MDWVNAYMKIKDGVLVNYLTKHKSEVKGMLLTEYNEAETMQSFQKEGRLAELIDLVKEGALTLAYAAKRASMSENDFKKLIQ